MTALRFMRRVAFRPRHLHDVHWISRTCVSKVINDVTDCLVRLNREDIKMPIQQELGPVIQGFHEIAGFSNVIGAVDGTHVKIKSPFSDEHLYVNRKNHNYHSVNPQVFCFVLKILIFNKFSSKFSQTRKNVNYPCDNKISSQQVFVCYLRLLVSHVCS